MNKPTRSNVPHKSNSGVLKWYQSLNRRLRIGISKQFQSRCSPGNYIVWASGSSYNVVQQAIRSVWNLFSPDKLQFVWGFSFFHHVIPKEISISLRSIIKIFLCLFRTSPFLAILYRRMYKRRRRRSKRKKGRKKRRRLCRKVMKVC